MPYFNTTHERGTDLQEMRSKAASQEDVIEMYYTLRPTVKIPVHQVHSDIFGVNTPITSVRRAITNLESRGKLSKTSHKVNGPYGRPVYTWVLAPQSVREQMRMEYDYR